MSISVVLPAHNEAPGITECLSRLISQDGPIDEIIVVDNNSTDATPELVGAAHRRDPRVRLVRETRPGVAYARYAGFGVARGEIIASIDSDTLVEEGWASALATAFDRHPQIVAGTGPMTMFDLPFQGRYRRRFEKLNDRAQRALDNGGVLRVPALSGANSAIRRSAWDQIADDVSYRSDLFEDLDRTLLLQERGHDIAFIPHLNAVVSGRRLLSGPRSFYRYAACGPRTYALHGKRVTAVGAWLVNMLSLIRTTVRLPANRAWDPAARRFSIARLFGRGLDRRASPIG